MTYQPSTPLWSAFVSSSSPFLFFIFLKTGSHPAAQGNLGLPATHLPPKCQLTKLVFSSLSTQPPEPPNIPLYTYTDMFQLHQSILHLCPHPFPSFCSPPEHWQVRLLLPFPIKPSSVHPSPALLWPQPEARPRVSVWRCECDPN